MRDRARRTIATLLPTAAAERRTWNETVRTVRSTEQRLDALAQAVDGLAGQLDALGQQVADARPAPYDDRLDVLRRLVERVEPYQPLYGVAGIIEQPARASLDRARAIESSLGTVRGQRILDIGSSLGFMCFYFADRGAVTTGWEYNPSNAEVARQVGALNGVPATFRTTELTADSVTTIPHGEYDAAFVLAVFHHVIHFQGLDVAQQIVRELLDRVPVLYVELASKGEDPDLFWDAAQPEDPLTLFDLVREDVTITRLASFGTHLSGKERPLYRIAREQVVTVAGRPYAFDRVSSEAYSGSPVAGGPWRRRYFHGPEHIVKEYQFSAAAPDNWQQILGELYLHAAMDRGEPVHHPVRLVDVELTHERALLVLERIPGELLCDLAPLSVAQLAPLVRDVLTTLRDLRARGFHHNDVRSWNILVGDDGGWLLDYGRASHDAIEDDVVALAWAVVAAVQGGREPSDEGKRSLPDLGVLDGTSLAAFAAALRDGERSPEGLLATL